MVIMDMNSDYLFIYLKSKQSVSAILGQKFVEGCVGKVGGYVNVGTQHTWEYTAACIPEPYQIVHLSVA